MATRTYRNITDNELWVQHLDRSVKPDEVIEVEHDPDLVWPDTTWAPVPKKSTTKSGE